MAAAGNMRRYFTVVDEDGRAAPVTEYWAAIVDEHHVTHEGAALRRFIKLLGSGERLEEVEEGVFVARTSRRTFFAVPPRQPH